MVEGVEVELDAGQLLAGQLLGLDVLGAVEVRLVLASQGSRRFMSVAFPVQAIGRVV